MGYETSHLHFGLIGLGIGDTIDFIPTRQKFRVASGNGTPDNGGSSVLNVDVLGKGLYSIRLAAKRMLGYRYNDGIDIWGLWGFKGRTLREIYRDKGLC